MKWVKLAIIFLVLTFAVAPASADILDFEDLTFGVNNGDCVSGASIGEYHGFTTDGHFYYFPEYQNNNLGVGTNGNYSLAHGQFGSLTILSTAAFYLEQFALTSSNDSIDVRGYLGSEQKFNTTFTFGSSSEQILATHASWADSQIDKLIIHAYIPGTAIGSKGVVDDIQFTYAPVPAPAAVWLLGSGLFGLVGLRRKFRK